MVKSNSEYKSIQKKLVAAVAMVLVASIMVVSSSYAWFTLSTAPEVTGIQTSVGSNGNLEMALMEEAGKEPQTATGVAYPSSNNYWGNLVNLSDPSYHFANMSLRPARLNAELDQSASQSGEVQKTKDGVLVWTTDNGTTEFAADQGYAGDSATAVYLADGKTQKTKDNVPVWQKANTEGEANQYAADTQAGTDDKAVMVTETFKEVYKFANGGFLQTPVYGVDGRVSQLTANTTNGVYDEDSLAFAEDSTSVIRGVRAVGTIADISPAELALRNAKQAVNAAISTSKTNATISLRDDSVKLANIIVANVLAGDAGATYGTADKDAIQTAIDHLVEITDSLEYALKQAVVAVGISKGIVFTAEDVSFESGTVAVEGVDADALWKTGTDLTARRDEILADVVVLDGMVTKLGSAQDSLDEITKETGITFAEISAPLTNLLTTQDFLITDPKTGETHTIEQFQGLGLANMAMIMLQTPTITIIKGIYLNIAQFSGNYSATTSMQVTGDFPAPIGPLDEKVTVVMATNAQEPFYLPRIQGWMSQLVAVGGTDEKTLLTDIYGYAVDLAFRTNAAGSSLLLQTEAANRVEDSELTQGSGSYLEFKSGHAEFTTMQVANLMNSIRVVFLNEDGSIYGIAGVEIKFDRATTTGQDGKEIEKVADANSVFTETVKEGTTTTTYELVMTGATLKADGATINAPLYMMNYSIESDGSIDVNGRKTDSVITEMPQNTAQYISALVYLDGDEVENSDVAIAGNSMIGTMNLQFSSSAELDPMDYTFQASKLAKTTSASITESSLTIANVTDAVSYKLLYGTQVLATINAGTGDKTIADISAGLAMIPKDMAGQSVKLSVVAVPAANSGVSESDPFEFDYTVPQATNP